MLIFDPKLFDFAMFGSFEVQLTLAHHQVINLVPTIMIKPPDPDSDLTLTDYLNSKSYLKF